MATGFSAIGDVFSNMSPEVKSSLINSGFNFAGGILSGKAAEKKGEQDTANSRLNTANAAVLGAHGGKIAQQNTDFSNKQGEISASDRLVLQAMGGSPLAFQKDRMKMDLTGKMLERGAPANLGVHGGPFQGGLKTSFGPSAEAEAPYWNAVATASNGRFAGPGLGSVYGKSGESVDKTIADRTAWSGDDWTGRWDDHTKTVGGLQDAYMGEAVGQRTAAQQALDAEQQKKEEEKKKGGFWSSLLKIAPMVAAFIPGVGPLAAMGIGAATNAIGSKVQGGSWKDAALSGAIGGVTGALGNKLAGGGSSGPGVNVNPATGLVDTSMVNQAFKGATGNMLPKALTPAQWPAGVPKPQFG